MQLGAGRARRRNQASDGLGTACRVTAPLLNTTYCPPAMSTVGFARGRRVTK